jgi:exodeoxyribonuclease V gamma subunit
MFILHQANRMEALFDELVELTATPLAYVLRPETILVQSQGMARWLSLELARATGISANLECPFPASFIWQMLAASAGLAGPSPYEPETMRWSVMELLSAMRDTPGFAPVSAYLRGEGKDLKRYQLAGRVAALLDQYLVHRPEWIEAWSGGGDLVQYPVLEGDEGWQAAIWRALLDRHGPIHRVALLRHFSEGLAQGDGARLDLPERISLFGIPALPASQLRFFAALGEHIDVHLFLLCPSGQFWADLASRRELVRAGLRHGSLDLTEDLHLDEGCQLLMGLGGLGRDFQALLQEVEIQPGLEHFADPGEGRLLHLVQSGLNAALKQPALADASLYSADQSIQIHAAHSPMREVEILHDRLLDLLARQPELEADDILVMVPEISTYAPLVEAVFSDPADEGTRLPFSIADRGGSGPLVKGFFDLLQLVISRSPVTQVLALMEQEPVRDGFAITAEEMELIRAWVMAVGINWGLSSEHRGRFGVPEERVGTWRTGLDRLLLGLLAPGGGATLIHGLLPADLLEAGQGAALAKLLNFFEAVTELEAVAEEKRTLAEWRETLSGLFDRFFDTAERYHGERQRIRTALDDLVQVSALAGAREPLPLEVVRVALEQRLASAMGNFLCGRITFCQMVPMRSIPFRVICLLGMNDNAFPRQERPPGFDLMAGQHRPGDRSRRDDDRYLFLETILSAREILYLSYVGMNAANAPVPPSVVVSELLDHLASRLGLDPARCEERFVTRHPLQPFSRRYFDGQLFSYSGEQQSIAASLAQGKPFDGLFGEESALATEPITAIDLDDLIRFFEHPVRALLRNRLGLYLDERDEQPAERECFSVDALQGYQLMSELTAKALSEEALADLCPIAQLKGEVSLGMAGRYQYEECREQAEELAERLRELRGSEPLAPMAVSLDLDGVLLSGVLDGLWPTGQFLYRPGKIKAMKQSDLLRTWIRHLVLCAVSPDESQATTFVYRDNLWHYPFCPEARAELLTLAALYQAGQGRPVALLPKSSLAYAQKLWGAKGGTEEQALAAARTTWQDGDYLGEAESRDPYLAAVYGDRDPLAECGPYGFAEVAARVLAPALRWGRKI